ncbi:MAG: hypothetical protein ABR910_11430 [Acidobacteriaceae bacterium]|jgi:hypothetical protein
MTIENILPVAVVGLVRKTILAVLIGLMGGGVAVFAQETNAGGAAPALAETATPVTATAQGAAVAAVPQEEAVPADTAVPEAASASVTGDAKSDVKSGAAADAATAPIAIPTATSEAQRKKEAADAAQTPMDAATAKAVKKLADKFKGKKGKQPKLTPLDIVQGTLTVDGWTGKARMNYDIADLKYLYIWAPGVGTVVVSNGWFAQSDIQMNAFNGNTLTLNIKGHTIQIASDKRMLNGKKPVPAFAYLDTGYKFPSAFPVMGYGANPLPPYAWPGATNAQVAKAGAVVPPPLPKDLRPVLAPPGCPPPGSKQALNMTPCALPVIPSASSSSTAAVAPTQPAAPTP